MKRNTVHRYELDESEQFTWIKAAAVFAGHRFTVERIELQLRDGIAVVYFAGPWIEPVPQPDPRRGTAGEHGGWDFLDLPGDLPRLWSLPSDVLAQLAEDAAAAGSWSA